MSSGVSFSVFWKQKGMNTISMERIEGIPPPPSSFNGLGNTTGYNFQGGSASNKFAKRKQSITGEMKELQDINCRVNY